MTPGIDFSGADDDLKRLGNAVVAFMREVSEASPHDLDVMLLALRQWNGPNEGMDLDDVATLRATIAALMQRLQHDDHGNKPHLLLENFCIDGLRPS
jgi:hypothetical protein